MDYVKGEATWRAMAACRDEDPRLFFPGRGQDPRPAKQVCEHCPVRDECLEFALEQQIKFGVFGGTSERERRSLRRARKEAA